MDLDAIPIRLIDRLGDCLEHRRAERNCDQVTDPFRPASDPLQIRKHDLAGSIQIESEISDEYLLEQLRDGNQSALALLFRRYARMVRSVAFRIVRDTAEADDLLQEVFLFIFRKWTLFDPARGSARSWILQVTYHRAIDRRRHLASRRFYSSSKLDEALLSDDGPAAELTFYERSIEGRLGTETLKRIEKELTEDQRRTIQLYFFDGYTFDEIAKLRGQTIGNVRNHYYRGLERIRQLIFAGTVRGK